MLTNVCPRYDKSKRLDLSSEVVFGQGQIGQGHYNDLQTDCCFTTLETKRIAASLAVVF